MSPLKVILIMAILCAPHYTWGQRKKKPPPERPIDKIQSVANFNLQQFSGTWYLLSVASECNYLKTENHRVEATMAKISPSKKDRGPETMAVSTFRKLDGICWEIKHSYLPSKSDKGRFTLKAQGYSGSLDMVVGDTDYQNYAILYYQKKNKITLKLYGRKTSVSDSIYLKFDDLVKKQGIDLEFIYAFPSYGFCDSADQFHILNEVPR
ncbi:complement component C8 gamma chain [Hyla sarda]|uniref:complement component C8 gamma chain n=1 Tax=Hyla sarda TaxID=327740 RepID=UPI0024C385CF|nr:complement component C8 gamma chain [Hyla sarda]